MEQVDATIQIEELIGFLYKFDHKTWEELRTSFPGARLELGKKLGGTSALTQAQQIRVGSSVAIEALNTVLDQTDEVTAVLKQRLDRDSQLQVGGLLGFMLIGIIALFVADFRLLFLIFGLAVVLIVLILQLRTQFSFGQNLSALSIYHRLTEKRSAAEYLQNRLLVISRFSVADFQFVEAVSAIEKANFLTMNIRRLLDQSPYRKKLQLSSHFSPSTIPTPQEEKIPNETLVEEVHKLVANARTEKAIHLLMEHYKGTGSERLHELIVLSARLKQHEREQNLGIGASDYEWNRINIAVLDLISA